MPDELGELIDPAEHARLLRVEAAAVALVDTMKAPSTPLAVCMAYDALLCALTEDLVQA